MSGQAPRATSSVRRAQARRRSTAERFAQVSDTSSFHAGSTVFSGLILFGGLGWLLGRWLDAPWPVPVGILLGAGLSFYVLWLRYGVDRSKASPRGDGEHEQAAPSDDGRTDHRPI